MKTLILAVLTLSLSACGTIANLTPGVTGQMLNKAVATCESDGDVHMVTQSLGNDVDVFCTNGKRHQL